MKRYKIIFILSTIGLLISLVQIIYGFGVSVIMDMMSKGDSSVVVSMGSYAYIFFSFIFLLLIMIVSKRKYQGIIDKREIMFYTGVVVLMYGIPQLYLWIERLVEMVSISPEDLMYRYTSYTYFYASVFILQLIVGFIFYFKGRKYYIEKEAPDIA